MILFWIKKLPRIIHCKLSATEYKDLLNNQFLQQSVFIRMCLIPTRVLGTRKKAKYLIVQYLAFSFA